MIIKQNRGRQWLKWRQRVLIVMQVIGAAGCVWLFVALFFGEMGLMRYLSMRGHAKNLEQELSALRRENATLQQDITRLQHDPAKIEQLAREQLGYVRKGETVYQLAPDPEKK
ncbi:MAG TPA: septum formation initiator family protein, partial [Terriglobia bacterium]|nr:septum formation initiator family protein [Terriglobia bacterium]